MTDERENQTLYDILEVDPNSDFDVIRKSYRRLVEESFSIESDVQKDARFHQLTTAWKVLCDDLQRAAYDKSLGCSQTDNNSIES